MGDILGSYHEGTVAILKMTIAEEGHAIKIGGTTKMVRALSERILEADPNYFHFNPAQLEGQPKAMKIGLNLSIEGKVRRHLKREADHLPMPKVPENLDSLETVQVPFSLRLDYEGSIESIWLGSDVPPTIALNTLSAIRQWKFATDDGKPRLGYEVEGTLAFTGEPGAQVSMSRPPAALDFTPPEITDWRAPQSDLYALRGGIASVIARWIVEVDGSASNITIDVSPDKRLSKLVIESLENAEFAPAKRDGEAVRVWIRQEFSFL